MPMTAHVRKRLPWICAVGAALAVIGHGAPAAAWDPLKSAGKSLASGVRAELEPMLATTIADVDKRASALSERVIGQANDAARDRLEQTNQIVAARLEQTDHILEKQVLNVSVQAQAVIKGGLDQVDDISRKRLVEAKQIIDKTVTQLDKTVARTLTDADQILKDRTKDLSQVVGQALDHADQVVAERIQQIDEAAGRRLANVDVIATKQRYGIEETLVRVAVLVGLVVFFVFVAIRLWDEWKKLAPALREKKGGQYWYPLLGGLGKPLARQIAAAGVIAGLFAVLYSRLPMGASAQNEALIARHAKMLQESLARLAYTDVRFHASQLQLLLPDDVQRYRALAAKADLLEQILSRPTTFSTPQGIRSAMDKVAEVERLFGDVQDPDVLVVKAIMLWQVGTQRQDEHEAASLCARAVRVGRGRFVLQPMAVNLLRSFLHAPYIAPDAPFGRDAEAIDDLEIALGAAGEPQLGFPLQRKLTLDERIRDVDRAVTRAYTQMIEAHATVSKLARLPEPGPALDAARKQRSKAAAEVVAAWKTFDAAVQAVPGLAGSPEVLALFRLNDATWTRALWFVERPQTNVLAPLLSALAKDEKSVGLRIMLAPPRVAWARRYAALLEGPARSLVELQEAQRFRTDEQRLATFEEELVTLLSAEPAVHADKEWNTAALHAAQLGLFVDGGTGPRLPYALELLLRLERSKRADRAPVDPRTIKVEGDVAAELEQRTLWLLARS